MINFKQGDLISVEGKFFKIEGSQLVETDALVRPYAITQAKNLVEEQEFVLFGNAGATTEEQTNVVVYLGTQKMDKRYYHELHPLTYVIVKSR